MKKNLKELEKKIGYEFQDFSLLEQAMMHSSYTNEKHLEKYHCNERLEFLGDAVLELVSSEFLFLESPKVSEGKLTKTRASMVCEPSLAFCAREIELGSYLLLGKGEEATGGRQRPSVTSDAMEALIGAIYLDGGFTNAKEFIHRFILTDLENKKLFYDSKTILQEIVQADMEEGISYHLIKEEGPDHNKSFTVEVKIGETVYGTGSGRTKKAAEQEAAYKAILKLKKQTKGCFMYLKCIEVQGFKSFANRIKFEFHNGITGIVGPKRKWKEQCGKNAVRWVLVESREQKQQSSRRWFHAGCHFFPETEIQKALKLCLRLAIHTGTNIGIISSLWIIRK